MQFAKGEILAVLAGSFGWSTPPLPSSINEDLKSWVGGGAETAKRTVVLLYNPTVLTVPG